MKLGVGLFVLLVLVVLGGILGFPGCGTLPTEELKIGRVKGVFLGSSSDLHDGFNWDLAQFLGQKLHKKIVFKELAWPNLIPALCNDEVDILCESLNITDKRKKEVALVHVFGEPYPYLTLLFWDATYQKKLENAKHIRDVIDFFENRTIGVAVQGGIWGNLLKEYGIKNIKTYEREADMVSGLRKSEVPAILLGRISTDFLKNRYSNIWALTVALDKPYSYGIGVAVNKDRPELVKQVTEAIQDLKDEGMIDIWQRKWFSRVY